MGLANDLASGLLIISCQWFALIFQKIIELMPHLFNQCFPQGWDTTVGKSGKLGDEFN